MDHERIAAAAVNAIHPWVKGSPVNRNRSKLGSFHRDWIRTDDLDPLPRPDDGVVQNLFDRMAFALSRQGEAEADDHRTFGADDFSNAICDRMSLLYGRMWNHENLTKETHEAFAHMLGPAPAGVYRHLYYYTLLERLTGRYGENRYLKRELIQTNWRFPTLFIHGEDSRVFNPYSAERSAARLKALNTNLKVGLLRVPGYGHMDVIIGKNAAEPVFSRILEFFEEPCDTRNMQDLGDAGLLNPDIGPMVRAAWIANDEIYVRLGVKLETATTRRVKELGIAGTGISKLEEVRASTSGFESYRIADLKIKSPPAELAVTFFNCLEGERADIDHGGSMARVTWREQAWYMRLRQRLQGHEPCGSTFLVGSCRFPGTIIDNRRSDAVFERMRLQLDEAEQVFFLGDQIYADATDELFRVDSFRSKFKYRYERAFKSTYSPNFARLAMEVPTHFTLDDHEISDNWSGDASQSAMVRYALDMAKAVQGSGRDTMQLPGLAQGAAGRFWYPLHHPAEAACPDVRHGYTNGTHFKRR
ncbi:MAG: alkaline phosphatase D family protein [Gammaproteobacteria bacterium]|nr:alkaline phosphatase D family protein [Gammaproteobacteria bacterium]